MTPAQQRFIDYAAVEAAAKGFAFELREPRDDREGAGLTVRGKSGYETLGISPDGGVVSVRVSQSYDADLSKFVKKLLAAGKKMRPKQEKSSPLPSRRAHAKVLSHKEAKKAFEGVHTLSMPDGRVITTTWHNTRAQAKARIKDTMGRDPDYDRVFPDKVLGNFRAVTWSQR